MTVIRWRNPNGGDFNKPSNWKGGAVPGADDDAIIKSTGADFAVSLDRNETVDSLQTGVGVTLAVSNADAGHFTTFAMTSGTGSGANAGTITASTYVILDVGGEFRNKGQVDIVGHSYFFPTSAIQLTGGGDFNLVGGNIKSITAGDTIENVDNTISGTGFISLPDFTNDAKGVVDATYSATHGDLVVAGLVSNDGLMEASNGGTLVAVAFGTIANSSTGIILASANSEVKLDLKSSITGGILKTAGNGEIVGNGGYIYNLTNEANIVMARRQGLGLGGDIINEKSITIDVNTAVADIAVLAGGATLSGGGSVILGRKTTAGNATISGVEGTSTLTNVDNTISGAGKVGVGFWLNLVNESAGVIEATNVTPLTLNVGAYTISNAGLIETLGASSNGVISSAIDNTGTLAAEGGTLKVSGAVTGSGFAVINAGTIDFASAFDEAVTFAGATGELSLARSQAFDASITGFSTTGGATLDLRDIGFVGAGEATFSGTASSGILTVTDGTHSAHITLKGDYLGATFVASSDGAGGTDVIATSGAASAPPHRLIAAMAGFGGSAGQAIHLGQAWTAREGALARPHAIA